MMTAQPSDPSQHSTANLSRSDAPPPAQTRGEAAPRCITSEELLAGARELLISHGETLYRLRLTKQGKLILHK